MKRNLDQTGMIPLTELVLAALVVSVLGFVLYRVYVKPAAAPTESKVKTSVNTKADGTVGNAINSVQSDAQTEAAASTKDSADSGQVSASNGAATNVGGSFDEKSF